ncbi:MAG TPA: hypothetical protein VFN61_05285 [Acidimicrobiales bacterium]|nr:hypothetical protein [Acidimicrobiales bacterium]
MKSLEAIGDAGGEGAVRCRGGQRRHGAVGAYDALGHPGTLRQYGLGQSGPSPCPS